MRWIEERVRDATIAESVIFDGVREFMQGWGNALRTSNGDADWARAERIAINYVLDNRDDLRRRALSMKDPGRVYANRWVNTSLIAMDSLRRRVKGKIDSEVRKALSY